MKKIIGFMICIVMLLSVVACGNKATGKETENVGGNSVEIPNPFVECETIDKAEQLAGFKISVLENIPEGFVQSVVRAIENELIEIIYLRGEDEICIRKAKGNENISGNYNNYAENGTMEFENFKVTIKGNNGKVNVATWVDGDYTYALSISCEGEGLDYNIIGDMIKNIK